MVIHADILRLTRIDGATYGGLEILPSRIAENRHEVSRKPNFYLLAIVALDILCNIIEGGFISDDAIFVHIEFICHFFEFSFVTSSIQSA